MDTMAYPYAYLDDDQVVCETWRRTLEQYYERESDERLCSAGQQQQLDKMLPGYPMRVIALNGSGEPFFGCHVPHHDGTQGLVTLDEQQVRERIVRAHHAQVQMVWTEQARQRETTAVNSSRPAVVVGKDGDDASSQKIRARISRNLSKRDGIQRNIQDFERKIRDIERRQVLIKGEQWKWDLEKALEGRGEVDWVGMKGGVAQQEAGSGEVDGESEAIMEDVD